MSFSRKHLIGQAPKRDQAIDAKLEALLEGNYDFELRRRQAQRREVRNDKRAFLADAAGR